MLCFCYVAYAVSIMLAEQTSTIPEKQLSDGYDPMVIVPRLAAYLGHKSYRETCWYIHLTVASFPELSQKLDRAFVGIIPVGGETDEEN